MEEMLSDSVVQGGEFFLDTYSPARIKCRIILLVIYIYIAGFDSISDLIAWGSFLKVGFGHPLLATPPLWSLVWGIFGVTALLLAMLATSHEVVRMFHLKGSFCKTHIELLPLVGLLFEDVPMLVLALLYGLSQYTCSTRIITESSDVLIPILISSIGTALATFWRLVLTLMKLQQKDGKPRDTGGRSVTAETHQTQAQREEESKQVCSLRCFMKYVYKTGLFLFGFIICVLSVLVVMVVSYLMVEKNPYFIHRPRDPLLIFAAPSDTSVPLPLINVSSVTDNERVSLIHNGHCLLTMQYRERHHKIVYNFADVTASNASGSDCGRQTLGTDCQDQLSNLFYGSYRNGSDGCSVEIFHEMCLAAYIVLPPIVSRPEWDENLEVMCV